MSNNITAANVITSIESVPMVLSYMKYVLNGSLPLGNFVKGLIRDPQKKLNDAQTNNLRAFEYDAMLVEFTKSL